MATYPSNIDTPDSNVYAILSNGLYEIYFPYSIDAVKKLKSSLPAPKFDGVRRCWKVNKRWHKKIPGVLNAIASDIQSSNDADISKNRKLEMDGYDAMKAMKPFSGGISLSFNTKSIRYVGMYHTSTVGFFNGLNGKFDSISKEWTISIIHGKTFKENRDNLVKWHNEAVHAHTTKKVTSKQLVLATDAPDVGSIILLNGRKVRIDRHGKMFRGNEDTSSLGGPIGAEGELVRYIYYTEL